VVKEIHPQTLIEEMEDGCWLMLELMCLCIIISMLQLYDEWYSGKAKIAVIAAL
jgi:hypothetical protein